MRLEGFRETFEVYRNSPVQEGVALRRTSAIEAVQATLESLAFEHIFGQRHYSDEEIGEIERRMDLVKSVMPDQ